MMNISCYSCLYLSFESKFPFIVVVSWDVSERGKSEKAGNDRKHVCENSEVFEIFHSSLVVFRSETDEKSLWLGSSSEAKLLGVGRWSVWGFAKLFDFNEHPESIVIRKRGRACWKTSLRALFGKSHECLIIRETRSLPPSLRLPSQEAIMKAN